MKRKTFLKVSSAFVAGSLLPVSTILRIAHRIKFRRKTSFTIAPADLHKRYDKYGDFMGLLKKYDPQGKFRNPYLDFNIYPA
jgi:hypothetical protein